MRRRVLERGVHFNEDLKVGLDLPGMHIKHSLTSALPSPRRGTSLDHSSGQRPLFSETRSLVSDLWGNDDEMGDRLIRNVGCWLDKTVALVGDYMKM